MQFLCTKCLDPQHSVTTSLALLQTVWYSAVQVPGGLSHEPAHEHTGRGHKLRLHAAVSVQGFLIGTVLLRE